MKDVMIRLYNKLTDKRKVYGFMGGKEFCQTNTSKYKILADEQEMEELRPCIWKIRETSEIYMHTLPETYIAEIEDATVFGENDMIMSRGMILSDEFTHKYADKMYLNKRIAKKVDLQSEKVELAYHYYRKLPVKEAFNLVGIFAFSYYHFLLNLLPKLYYLYQCEEYREVPLLLDRRAYENFKQIIDLYNIHNRPIICVGADVAFKVKKLIVTSNCAWYDRYVGENYFAEIGHVYDKAAIMFVREIALKTVRLGDKRKRVFVSRKKQPIERRRLINEEVVENLFQKYGFVSVYPEELTFLEQVQLFSETKIFAGVTGAAFTNIVFLPKDATVIYATCVKGNTGENLYPTLWNTVGTGKFITLQGEEETGVGVKDNLRQFRLNIVETEELLQTL